MYLVESAPFLFSLDLRSWSQANCDSSACASAISGVSAVGVKTFERGREDSVGDRGACGRLVELGERERGPQPEAARGLFFRDGDSGLERVLRRRGIGWIALQQRFAARPVQFRFECTMANPFARRQRFVEDRKGAVDTTGADFSLSERNLDEFIKQQNLLFA